jgi:hypothetical protein
MKPTFVYLLDAEQLPVLSSKQHSMISDFSADYASLFNGFDEAIKALVYFDREDTNEPIAALSASCFHKKDYLEAFAAEHMEGIFEFIKHNDASLGPPSPFPDSRLDNMFGQIDYEKDDFALAKLGKIGVHIAGKLLKDYPPVAEAELSPHLQSNMRQSCGF